MQTARFFEDFGGPGRGRRLLLGLANFQPPWVADGGRREAVRLATMADVEAWPREYAVYYYSFAPPPEAAARAA